MVFLKSGIEVLVTYTECFVCTVVNMLAVQIFLFTWGECWPMAWETRFQSQVKSDQRLKKWYLIPSCFTLFIIRHGSSVKRSNPENGVAPFRTPWQLMKKEHSDRLQLLSLTLLLSYRSINKLKFSGIQQILKKHPQNICLWPYILVI